METMRVPIDELSIFVGLVGLAQANPPVVVEELVTAETAEAIFLALQAELWENDLKLHRLLN
jgi:hypothetical protein